MIFSLLSSTAFFVAIYFALQEKPKFLISFTISILFLPVLFATSFAIFSEQYTTIYEQSSIKIYSTAPSSEPFQIIMDNDEKQKYYGCYIKNNEQLVFVKYYIKETTIVITDTEQPCAKLFGTKTTKSSWFWGVGNISSKKLKKIIIYLPQGSIVKNI